MRLAAYLPSCILSKFYIKPQRPRPYAYGPNRCILSKFYIKPQLSIVISYETTVVSYRNSTSNHNPVVENEIVIKLYLIEILHQTTTQARGGNSIKSCILSKFYIKPQHLVLAVIVIAVVSYRNSTSNHNPGPLINALVIVVSYRNSTSNHNVGPHID